MTKRRRNPQEFTTDEAQTATLILTEGTVFCFRQRKRGRLYQYPIIAIAMCDKEALIPASRTMGVKIGAHKTRVPVCPRELFPPEGKGTWYTRQYGRRAQAIVQKLDPLLTTHFKQRWKRLTQTCPPKRP